MELTQVDVSRRTFVAAAAATTAALTCCGALEPCVLATGNAPAAPATLDAGDAKAFGQGVTDRFAKSDKVFIVRTGDTLVAASATCTHRTCTLKAVDASLRCPCHGSRYDTEGKVTKGPAKNALPRYAVTIGDNGHLMVDKSKTFAEPDWGNPGASVKVS